MQRRIIAAAALCVAALALAPRARATSGIFAISGAGDSAPVMTGQRIVVAILDTETIVWDQVQYSGSPSEFGWVIPVTGEGAIDLASDDFFERLDEFTAPQFIPPQSGACANDGTPPFDSGMVDAGEDASAPGPVVAPTDMTVLTAAGGTSIAQWLATHDYSTTTAGQNALQTYVARNMDFVAMRMLPLPGMQATRPVRIHFPPRAATLALPMMLAGIGPTVDVRLWIFSRDRQEPQNYAVALVDPNSLVWSWDTSSTNYDSLLRQTLQSTANGHSFVREFLEQAASLAPDFGTLTFQPDAGFRDGGSDTAIDDWARASENAAEGIWLSRLRSTFAPASLDMDVQFANTTAMALSGSYEVNQQSGDGPNGLCRGGLSLGGGGGNGISCTAVPGRASGWPRDVTLALVASALAVGLARRRRH